VIKPLPIPIDPIRIDPPIRIKPIPIIDPPILIAEPFVKPIAVASVSGGV